MKISLSTPMARIRWHNTSQHDTSRRAVAFLLCMSATLVVPAMVIADGPAPAESNTDESTLNESPIQRLLDDATRNLRLEAFETAARQFTRAQRLAGGTSVEAWIGLATTHNRTGDYGLALDEAERALALTADATLRGEALNEKGLALYRAVQESWDTLADPSVATRVLADAEQAFRLALLTADPGGDLDGLELNLAGVLVAQMLLDESWRGHVELRTLLEGLADRLPKGEEADWTRDTLSDLSDNYMSAGLEGTSEYTGPPIFDPDNRDGGEYHPPSVVGRRANPQYTEAARNQRIQGVVQVRVVVGTAGQVIHTEIVRGLDEGLDQSAMDAIREWRFEPATHDGRPVVAAITFTTNFRLQ